MRANTVHVEFGGAKQGHLWPFACDVGRLTPAAPGAGACAERETSGYWIDTRQASQPGNDDRAPSDAGPAIAANRPTAVTRRSASAVNGSRR